MSSSSNIVIPDGFWQDPQGRLIPASMVKPIDQLRDQTVRKLVQAAMDLNEDMAEFKSMAFDEVSAFIAISASDHGVSVGGLKGNVTLTTYDGQYRVQRAFSAVLVFDEQVQIAKSLVDECIKGWTSASHPAVQALINEVFRADAQGELPVNKVYELRRLQIDDEKWQKAMQILTDSIRVDHTRSYLRFYQRTDEGEFVPIPLDLATVRVGRLEEKVPQEII
ncbi:hypothetical protein SIID45300_01770 [Candidatus Magnetaquicoccaceae bacterium FCR-1]|uniref:Sulfate transporter n=1 Tax=Candidatus Magnetaquiglobus chichijimensis TaxID=3141448 RepID=A0ABQ0C977_9PROT